MGEVTSVLWEIVTVTSGASGLFSAPRERWVTPATVCLGRSKVELVPEERVGAGVTGRGC